MERNSKGQFVGFLDKEAIRRLYCEEKLSSQIVAQKLGCTEATVRFHLHKLGCLRTSSEAQKLAIETGRAVRKGEGSPTWKGGRTTRNGYALIKKPGHPRADKGGYVLEHIFVWEETHNQPLPKGWVIHHLNGIRSDNRPQNLVAMPEPKHRRKYLTLLQERAKKIRELEVENRQLRRALEDGQMLFTVSEN